ncbi:hypothetical protein TrRE_jg189, partial [Triparma retinervis]
MEGNAGLGEEAFEALRALGAGDVVRVKAAKEFLARTFATNIPAARATKAAAQTLVSVGVRTRDIEIIKSALGSSHDANVAAVKGLKKLLSNMDDLGGEEEREFWGKVGVVLKGCLEMEVRAGARGYQPNVRRISRSLVLLENDFNVHVGLGKADCEWLWLGRNDEHKEVDNVVELVAIAGGGRGKRFDFQIEHSGDVRSTSWRCRLSVCEALGKGEGLKTRFLDFLQDEDVDVRKSASRGVGYDVVAEKAVVCCCEESGLTQEQVLEIMGEKVRAMCEGLLDHFQAELEGTKELLDGIDSLNLGGTRRIFEEEKTCMFSECMLGVQALASVFLGGGKRERSEGGEKEDDGLVELARSIISLANDFDPRLFAMAASSGAIFEKLHCLCLYVILRGGGIGEGAGAGAGVTEALRVVVEGTKECNEEIRKALKGLLVMDRGSEP